MQHYLIVANRTLGGPALAQAVRTRLGRGPCRFHVVVPATRHPDLLQRVVDAYTGEPDEDEVARARAEARRRLDDELARLRDLGAEADGEVGSDDPVEAVRDAAGRVACDEVILSTLPAGASQWLRLDLPHRLDRAVAAPVVHVEGPAAD